MSKKNKNTIEMVLPAGIRMDLDPKVLVLNLEENRESGMDESSIQDLASDLLKHGMLQNVVVNKSVVDGKEIFTVMGGNRRTLAAVKAGLKTVPALVYENLNADDAFLVRALENEKRVDPSFIDRAKAMARAVERGWTQKKIAEVWGVYGADVSKTLDLLKLPKELQKQIHEGYFTFKAAMALKHSKPEVTDLVNQAVSHVVDTMKDSKSKQEIKAITTEIVSKVSNNIPDSGVKDPKEKPAKPDLPPINLVGAAEPPKEDPKPRQTGGSVGDIKPPTSTGSTGSTGSTKSEKSEKSEKPENVPAIPTNAPPRERGLSKEGIIALLNKIHEATSEFPIGDFIEDLLGAIDQAKGHASTGELIEMAKSFKM